MSHTWLGEIELDYTFSALMQSAKVSGRDASVQRVNAINSILAIVAVHDGPRPATGYRSTLLQLILMRSPSVAENFGLGRWNAG